jgi:ABC-2 type transport system permease protein
MINIFTKECRQLFLNKKIWICIGLVLIIIIISTSYNGKNYKNDKNSQSASDMLRFGVINHDRSIYSDMLLSYFESSKTFTGFITIVRGNDNYIKNAFKEGALDIYIVIPENFAQSMMVLDHKPIVVNISIHDTIKAIIMNNVLKSYEKYIAAVEANAVGLYDIMEKDGMEQDVIRSTNEKISIDMILTALGREAFFSLQPLTKFPATTVVQYYLNVILVMFWMYAGLYVGFQLIEEVRLGTFIRLKVANISAFQFLTAKTLLMTSVLAVLVMLTIQVQTGSSLNFKKCLFAVAVSAFCVNFAVLLAALFSTTQRYILVGNLLCFFCIVMGGGIIPIQFLPQDIIRISRLTPNYYIMKGLLLFRQGSETQPVIIIMAAFFAVSMIFFGMTGFFLNRRGVTYE